MLRDSKLGLYYIKSYHCVKEKAKMKPKIGQRPQPGIFMDQTNWSG